MAADVADFDDLEDILDDNYSPRGNDMYFTANGMRRLVREECRMMIGCEFRKQRRMMAGAVFEIVKEFYGEDRAQKVRALVLKWDEECRRR